MANKVPPRAAALISSRPLLLVSQWKDVFGQEIHPCGAHYPGSNLQAPWHSAAGSPKSTETLTQGCRSRAQHSQSTGTNTPVPSCLGKCLQQHRGTAGDTSGVTLRDSTQASCRKGSHSTALLSCPCRARAGQAQGVETTESLVGRNRVTAAQPGGDQPRDLGHFSKGRPPPPCQRPNLLSTHQSPPALLTPRPQGPCAQHLSSTASKCSKQHAKTLNGEEYLWPI